MLYRLVNKILMQDFSNKILHYSKKNTKLIIFDIGCFRGSFSNSIKKKTSNSKFYLFDPNPNLKIKNFTYFPIGIGDSKKIINFNLNNYFPSSGSSMNTLIKNDIMWQISRKIITFNFFGKFTKIKVKQDTLDNFVKKNQIPKIDILKIDTEGHELKVLYGAKKILKKTKIIQLEILERKEKFNKKSEKILKFLNSYGFTLIIRKNIWSVGIFSNIKSNELLFVKK